MNPPYRILFVCMGNICRSPAAECVLRTMLREQGLEDRIEVDSAGTLSYHAGCAPDERMCDAAARRGIELAGEARRITSRDLEIFDLVLTMDEDNYRGVLQFDPGGRYRNKIRRFCEFCENFDHTEVPDPYYGGGRGFEHVLDLIEDGCTQIKNYALKQLES